MSNRLPLTANKDLKRIEELPAGDNLDLSQSGIVNAETIQSKTFTGNLVGVASTAVFLTQAENILSGTISTQRLSGTYNINITGHSESLLRAENILDGIINPARLDGLYDIDITGTTDKVKVNETSTGDTYYPTFSLGNNSQDLYIEADRKLSYIPSTNRLGIGTTSPTANLDVVGNVKISGEVTTASNVTAINYFGNGANLVGIVTQIIPSIGININETQIPGKGVVTIDAYNPVGKTIFVSQNGDDNNTGLTENDPKRTIKAAATLAVFGDTIRVNPGVYVENNPIVLKKTVSVEGTELRNCVITPKYPYLDLFHVNNGCHITDVSFIGPEMTDGASIVALQPLQGVEVDRYFDAARMIRMNLDYIAEETVGYLTSTSYKTPSFTVVNSSGITTDPVNCRDDIKSVWKGIIYDITRGGNSKSVGAGLSYYSGNTLVHIGGTDLNGYSVKQATIDAIKYSFDIARAVVNNSTWGGVGVGATVSVTSAIYDKDTGIISITANNHGLIKNDSVKITGLGFTCPSGVGTVYYPSGEYGYIFNVNNVVDTNTFEVVVGYSTLPHTYVSGGTIRKHTNFQNKIGQVKDLSIQKDPLTGFNNSVTGCHNVVSAMHSCVGIVTNIINSGNSAFSSPIGIRTTYPGNSGIGFTTVVGVTTAVYDHITGKTTITAPGLNIKRGDVVELRDLYFSCTSGGPSTIQKFPSGKYEYEFYVDKINVDSSFDVYVGISTLPHSYIGGGVAVKRSIGVTTAVYSHTTGITTIKATGSNVRVGDLIELRDLQFSCTSGAGTTTLYPTGNNGYKFRVLDIVTDKPSTITTATYNNSTGITTIVAPNFNIKVGDLIELRGLEFNCMSGAGTTTIYPTGNNGYRFRVLSTVGTGSTFTVNVGPSTIHHTYVSGGTVINRTNTANDTFTVNVGISTISHNYVSGGIVIPPYSKGVGPITQGPYVRNATNFIPKSIGMKVEGFDAEPGDQDDIGVTGTMSVDSYTQYNQGGIGVSITNGAYAQLVSIFTICDDIAVYTGSGGQCDITNSNSSFGRLGLVSQGVGDEKTKSIYHYTGATNKEAPAEQAIIEVSNIGNLRPYDGQSLYFGRLYYTVQKIIIEDGGSGYNDLNPPIVTFSPPEGENGITAEALCTVSGGKIVSVDIVSTGTQYEKVPSITLSGANQSASFTVQMSPIYYTIESATLPSAGISTIILNTNLNNTVSIGTTVYFSRLSLQITSSHSFEWVGSGNDINKAKPALGGVVNQQNEVVKLDGGECVYTSTDQAGNFRIGDGLVVNQLTGTVSGRAFSQSLLSTVTPLIVALG